MIDVADEMDARDKKWKDEAKATGLKPILRPGYDDLTLEGCLLKACMSFSCAEYRWTIARKKGMTDDEIKKMLGDEFGIQGGSHGYDYAGGANPRFWWSPKDYVGTRSKPTLQGQPLLDTVRRIFKIPNPGQGLQAELF